MPVKICPHCHEHFVVSKGTTDYVHNCSSGNPTLDNEDVPMFHTSKENPDGTTSESTGNQFYRGAANVLQYSEAGIKGKHFGGTTRRGNNPSTTITRKHFEHIDFE